MKYSGIILAIFWFIVIIYPDFLRFLIGWFFIFLWGSIFLLGNKLWKTWKKNEENYVKFGNYKIYR